MKTIEQIQAEKAEDARKALREYVASRGVERLAEAVEHPGDDFYFAAAMEDLLHRSAALAGVAAVGALHVDDELTRSEVMTATFAVHEDLRLAEKLLDQWWEIARNRRQVAKAAGGVA